MSDFSTVGSLALSLSNLWHYVILKNVFYTLNCERNSILYKYFISTLRNPMHHLHDGANALNTETKREIQARKHGTFRSDIHNLLFLVSPPNKFTGTSHRS